MSQIEAELSIEKAKITDSPYRVIGYVTLFLTFGVFGTWSYFAPLENAAIAPGYVTVKYTNKQVSHLEGGIIKRLLVEEGKKVASGDVLLELEDIHLKSEVEQLNSRYLGIKAQKESSQKLESSYFEEIGELKGLLVEGFADKQELRTRERDHARARGRVAELDSDMLTVLQKLKSVEDRLERTFVRAPVDGTVLNLMIHTEGGVISPAAPILDIVPDGQELTITAHVATQDIDRVTIGLNAEIRLSAFNQSTTPKLLGTVINLSADRLVSKEGNQFYKAQIALLPESVEDLAGLELLPGMPAELLILTGERTLLQYLAKPITDAFARSFIED